jgi:hypothetical protein
MPIVLADVKSPAGDVNGAVWFPALSSGDVDTLLTGFIADAYTKTDDDAAAEQWVYYRAATEVADRMTASPASVTRALVDQGSKAQTTIQAQIDYWVTKAQSYLAAFESAVVEEEADPLAGFSVLTSLRHGA